MLRNNWLLKLLVVLMIQALLLTQVEFSLAAAYHSQESYQEAALKFQRMTDRAASLIIGAGCVRYSLSGISVPRFAISTVFLILGGSAASSVELISGNCHCAVSNVFYKVFIHLASAMNAGIDFRGIFQQKQGSWITLVLATTAVSRAPPANADNIVVM